MIDVLGVTRKRVGSVFYGWWIVAAGFLIQMLNGGLLFHGFTVYFVPLQVEFGWSRALVASGFGFTRFESAILGPIQGWAIDKFGSRIVTLIGVTAFGAGFIIFSFTQSIFHYFAAFFFLALGSSLGGFLPISAAVTNWFARKRSRAIGITMMGMGLGGLLVPLLAVGVTEFGWRTAAVASGVLIWTIGIPAGLFMRHKPEPYGYLPDGDRPEERTVVGGGNADDMQRGETSTQNDFTAREALKTPAFWFITGGHASALLVVASVSIHQVPHMVQRLNMSLEGASVIVSVLMGMMIVGQFMGGFLGDKMSKRVLLVGCMMGHSTGLLMLAYATSTLHLVAFAALHGMAWGARGPNMQSLRAEFFGRSSFATIMGFSSIITMMGMMVSPIFSGWLADIQGGSYTMAFTILAVLTGAGSLFFWFAKKPEPPSRRSRGSSAETPVGA